MISSQEKDIAQGNIHIIFILHLTNSNRIFICSWCFSRTFKCNCFSKLKMCFQGIFIGLHYINDYFHYRYSKYSNESISLNFFLHVIFFIQCSQWKLWICCGHFIPNKQGTYSRLTSENNRRSTQYDRGKKWASNPQLQGNG